MAGASITGNTVSMSVGGAAQYGILVGDGGSTSEVVISANRVYVATPSADCYGIWAKGKSVNVGTNQVRADNDRCIYIEGTGAVDGTAVCFNNAVDTAGATTFGVTLGAHAVAQFGVVNAQPWTGAGNYSNVSI